MTPRVVGPVCQTFRTPAQASPMSSDASMNLLEVLRLVPMEDPPPPCPLDLSMSEDSEDRWSTVDTASTISCDTEGSRSSTSPTNPIAMNGCVSLTLTGPEPTGFLNLRTTHDVPRGTGQMGPAICRCTAGLTSDQNVRHSPGRVRATDTRVTGMVMDQCTYRRTAREQRQKHRDSRPAKPRTHCEVAENLLRTMAEIVYGGDIQFSRPTI